jgi:chromosome partitioning protein
MTGAAMPIHVIAVANCKGGTGKTTTAVNVAAELARSGLRVLLVDFDPQGHAGLGFGIRAEKGAPTAHDLLRGGLADPGDAICLTAVEGVDVLPSDRTFRNLSADDDPSAFLEALHGLRNRYDVAVVDTPPAAETPMRVALGAANTVLIPTQLNHLAHDGLQQLFRLLFAGAVGPNPGAATFAIVPVQVDMRLRLQQQILAELLFEFGHNRIFRGIRTDVALAEAFGSRCPVRHYRPQTRGAVDYTLLVQDILHFWPIAGGGREA